MKSGENMRDIQMVLERWGAGPRAIALAWITRQLLLVSKDFFPKQVNPAYLALMTMP